MRTATVYHIPVCPFSQRLEIWLALKGLRQAVTFMTVDITKPRPAELLALSNGSTALPILQTAQGQVLRESLVILQYLEDLYPKPHLARQDPYQRAVENMLTLMADGFANLGYTLVMNQDLQRREALHQGMRAQYARLNQFLLQHAPAGPYLFEDFGWAEIVFTPLFMRFWFLDYYEGFDLPDEPAYSRVRQWREACLQHPAAQQVGREEIVKLYYDYAKGMGNGGLLAGRQKSSFTFDTPWQSRPWPPADKYHVSASDAQLGL